MQIAITFLKSQKYKDFNMLLNNAFRFGFCMLFIPGSTSALGIEHNKISYFMITQ